MLHSCLPAPTGLRKPSITNRSIRSADTRTLVAAKRSPLAVCQAHRHTDASSDGSGYSSNAAAAVLAGLVMLSSAAPAAASLAVLEGPARIVDGDTLYIGQDKVRLYAVDAPEKSQACNNSKGQPYPCGLVSLNALKEHVGNKLVRCEVKAKDQYGRNVAACTILAGRLSEDMGDWLVSNGYAVAYRQYGKDYIVKEEKAHARHVGIWQGDFTEPALWRKQQKTGLAAAAASSSSSSSLPAAPSLVYSGSDPLSAAASATAAGLSYATAAAVGQQAPAVAVDSNSSSLNFNQKCSGALIKGNINSKGQKIYHTINSGAYMRVEIDEKAGERYFCTEEEAQAAGWRSAVK